jgi:GGDEF domain-containing protein
MPTSSLRSRALLEREYRREAALARRRGSGLGLVLVRVQNLDAIRAEHSYLMGETTLQAVAEVICSWTRESDLSGRIDEASFLIITPEQNAPALQLIETRLRHRLDEFASQMGLPPVVCSVSTLGTTVTPRSLDELLAHLNGPASTKPHVWSVG